MKNLLVSQVASRLKMNREDYEKVEGDKLRPTLSQFKILVKYLDLDLVMCASLMKEELRRK